MAGRPSIIDTIVDYRPDGTPITTADRITNALRAGSYFEQATASAGIPKETAYGWLRTAGRVKLRARGEPIEKLRPRATAHERRCIAFSDAVAEADSSWEVGALATLERLARGGIPQVKTVTKRGPSTSAADGTELPGPVLDVTTTTEYTLPSAQVLEWRLERRFPDRYGRKVEVTGAEGGPIGISLEDRTEALVETLRVYLEGAAAGKAEADKPRRKRVSDAVEGRAGPGPT